MKKFPSVVTKLALPSSLRTLAAVALIGTATSSHAALIVGESFEGYSSTADLLGQAATGFGLTGNWGGSQYYRTQDTGLTMAGVYSTGGSLAFPKNTATGDNARAAFAAFSTAPSADTTYFGSYLFKFNNPTNTVPRTFGVLGVGAPTDTVDNAPFIWGGNGYNTQASPVREGPTIRAKGSAWGVPGISLTSGQTYIMLFQFNASAGTTSAWVLNEAQLANFSSSLNAATLNAAVMNTESSTGIAWGGTASTGTAITSMSNLMMFASISTNTAFNYTWDEVRISNTNLTEAVTAVPEPSTIAALGFGLGALTLRHTLRRRRTS